MINFINLIATKLLDLLLLPFKTLGDSWGLIFISALAGVLLIFVYGKVSNQKAIKKVKRKISASILEVILYRHDISLCLKAQGGMLLAGAKYFLLAVPPLLILMIPCIVILSQLNLRYESRPLKVGETLLLTTKLNDSAKLMNASLNLSGGLEASEPVRIPEANEIVWKIRAKDTGEQKLTIQGLASKYEKPLFVETAAVPLYAQLNKSWLWTILYPQDNAAFANEFSEIKLSYPKGEHFLFSLKLHWVIIFFIVSLVSGLVASKLFKIEI